MTTPSYGLAVDPETAALRATLFDRGDHITSQRGTTHPPGRESGRGGRVRSGPADAM